MNLLAFSVCFKRFPVSSAIVLFVALGSFVLHPGLAAESADLSAGRTIRLIVPFGPGGSADTLARAMADPVGRHLGTAVVVENRTGAGGLVANGVCARAKPDGETLCLGSAATHSVLPHQHPGRIGADAAGFTPVTRIGDEASVIVTRRDSGLQDIQALLAWGRGQPSVQFGVGGTSSTGYLMMLQISQATGIRFDPVPYRGGMFTPTALIAGEVPIAVGPVSSFIGALRGGEIAPLLILGPARSALLPQVPTIGEAVVPGAGVSAYVGVFAPAGMPEALANRLDAAIALAFQDPGLRDRATMMGIEIALLGPAAFAAWLRETSPAWATVVALATPAAATGN